MTSVTIIFGIVLIGFLAFIAWKIFQLQPSENTQDTKLGELNEKLRAAESKRDELSGKNKELFASKTTLEAELKSLSRERDGLNKELAQYEATEKKREEQIRIQMQQLESAKQALADERMRVQREDEERLQEAEEERDRVWNDHEMNVIAILRDLCKKPEYAFPSFDNTNLPKGFDGGLKPDFLIEFLGQYVIFDAKVSKAKSLQTYIADTVKKTIEKVKGNDKIAKFLYLVVPTSAIAELKGRTSFANGDYNVYIVSPDALAPVLSSLKRITHYELAEKFDPMERENIVNLIANYDWHISYRSALDITLAKQATELVGGIQGLSPDIVADVLDRKEKLPIALPSKIDIKRLLHPDNRKQEISDIESPRPRITKKAIEAAKAALFE